jgi:S1-C subfamily serine protease
VGFEVRQWLYVLAGGFVGICLSFTPMTTAIASTTSDRTVFIEIIDTASNIVKVRGSGFLVGTRGFFMTAKHLFENYDKDSNSIKISLKTKQDPAPIEARIFDCTPRDVDLCMLYIDKSYLDAAQISSSFEIGCRFPVDQEPVSAAGYPQGGPSPLIQTPGNVTSAGLGIFFKTYMTAVLIDGMSGGPVLDNKNIVIGVVFGAAQNNPALTFFTPIVFGVGLLNAVDVACIRGE